MDIEERTVQRASQAPYIPNNIPNIKHGAETLPVGGLLLWVHGRSVVALRAGLLHSTCRHRSRALSMFPWHCQTKERTATQERTQGNQVWARQLHSKTAISVQAFFFFF